MRKILFLGALFLSLSSLAQHVTLSCAGPCGGSTAGPNCGYGFYRSADDGTTWSLLNATPTAACRYVDSAVHYNGASYKYYAVTVDPSYATPDSGASNTTAATMPQQPPADAMATFDNALPAGSIIAPGLTTFSWASNPGQNVQSYDLDSQELQGQNWVILYDTQYGGPGQVPPGGSVGLIPAGVTSAPMTIPRNGNMIHLNLRTNFIDGSSAWQDLFYREQSPAGVPQILTPLQFSAPCSSSGTATFTWSNGPSDTTAYYLHAGTSPGAWDLANWNLGMTNTATVPLLGQGPRVAWINITASSPTKGLVTSDLYAAAFVACHSIN